MPIDYAKWVIEHQVLFARAYGYVSRTDMIQHNHIVIEFLDNTEIPIHVILDGSEMGLVEPSFPEVQTILTFQKHPKIGWAIYISGNRVINRFTNLMARVAGVQYRQFTKLQDGLALLQQQHPELQWDSLTLTT